MIHSHPFHVLLVMCLLALVVPGHLSSVSGVVSYAPGVRVVDWWNYGRPTGSWPIGIIFNVSAYTFVVTSVSGNDVALKAMILIDGGNTQTTVAARNLETGSGNLTGSGNPQLPPLVAAGLGPGDPLFNSPSAPTVNYTITANFAGAAREVNVVNVTSTSFRPGWEAIFYDKQTGIATQVYQSSAEFFLSLTLTGTSLWAYHVSILDDSDCTFVNNPACRYDPSSPTVIVGTTVTWENMGGIPHTVTSCSSSQNSPSCSFFDDPSLPTFDSGMVVPGGNFTFTFATIGTYYYGDLLHPWILGTIAVVGNATATVGTPDFTISTETDTLTLPTFGIGTFFHPPIITIKSVNNFAGTVHVVATVNPPGLVVGLSSASQFENSSLNLMLVPNGENATALDPTVLPSTAPGTYIVTVTASSGSITHVVIVTIIVSAPGGSLDFSISADPSFLIIPAGGTATSTILLTSLNGFVGPVYLSTSPSPACPSPYCPSWSISPGIVTLDANGTAAATLSVFAGTGPQIYWNVTVYGNSRGLSHAATVGLSIGPSQGGPDFLMTATPTFLTIQTNDPFSRFSSITVTGLNGFSGVVGLTVFSSGSPLDVTLDHYSVTLGAYSSANATLAVRANGGTFPGTYFVTVTGSNGTTSHSVNVSVQVIPPPSDFGFGLTSPPGGPFVIAGQTTFISVGIFSLGPVFFNGTVTLTVEASPVVASGPVLSFNPSQVSLVPPGPSTSTLTVSTSSATPPGNYMINITGTSGSLVHSAQVTLTVLAPPVLTVSPSSGSLGTMVTVHGSGFPSQPQDPFGFPVQVEVTFDDQFLGIIYIEHGSFDFTFNVPHAQPGIIHHIHAIEQFPIEVDAQADFTVLPEPSPSVLSVSVTVGSLYFPGETAIIYVQTSLNGQPVQVSDLQVVVVRPDGSNVTLSTVPVATGVGKASYPVPNTGSIGTYEVVVKAHRADSVERSALGSFEVKPTWLQANGPKVITATGIVGAVGVAGVLALAWRRGFLTRRRDEFPAP